LSARRKAQKAGAEAAKGSNGLPVTLDDGDWDDLECLQYFSGDDLDWSLGQIVSAGAALVVGYQYLLITGGTSVFHEPYFRNEPCPGYMLGLGAGANWLTGFWIRCGRVMRYRAHMKPKIVLALPPLDPCRRVRAVVLPRGQLGSLLGTEVPRLASGPEPVTGDARCPLVKLLKDPHGGGSPDGIGKAQGRDWRDMGLDSESAATA
jgi:hypothetical protein